MDDLTEPPGPPPPSHVPGRTPTRPTVVPLDPGEDPWWSPAARERPPWMEVPE